MIKSEDIKNEKIENERISALFIPSYRLHFHFFTSRGENFNLGTFLSRKFHYKSNA